MLTATHLRELIEGLPARIARGDDVGELANSIAVRLESVELADPWQLIEYLGVPPPDLGQLALALADQCARGDLVDQKLLDVYVACRLRDLERHQEAVDRLEPHVFGIVAADRHSSVETNLVVTLAGCLSDAGNVRAALDYSRSADSWAYTEHPSDVVLRARALSSLVAHLWMNREVTEALGANRRLLILLDGHGSDLDLRAVELEASMRQPLLHFEAGQISQAVEAVESALGYVEGLSVATREIHKVALAHFFNNAGIVSAEGDRAPLALRCFADAKRIYYELLDTTDRFESDLGSLLMNEARLLAQLGRPGSGERINAAVDVLRRHNRRLRTEASRLELALALRTRALVASDVDARRAWRDARAAEYLVRSNEAPTRSPALETLIRIADQKARWAPSERRGATERLRRELLGRLTPDARRVLEAELRETAD